MILTNKWYHMTFELRERTCAYISPFRYGSRVAEITCQPKLKVLIQEIVWLHEFMCDMNGLPRWKSGQIQWGFLDYRASGLLSSFLAKNPLCVAFTFATRGTTSEIEVWFCIWVGIVATTKYPRPFLTINDKLA
ncbi:hypothetical protein llap_7807 [Limosa lapponica baueri]|uniref:Uncharacterized protein n=1 Tax=Limosa lapponica baueri TaxID=1758121 RepID=A0A2I0U788_LIMLA|nr:hypothetical protein llap_7807 [Limosa lapponica baueri]